MMTSIAPPRAHRQQWLLIGGAAIWVAAYAINEKLWDWLFFDLAGQDPANRWAEGARFFFYDSVKITLLLVGLSFLVGIINTHLSPEHVRTFLSGRGQLPALLLAIALGAITPFCSCSSIPIFIGLVAAGVPLSVTLTFLVASPLISETGIILMGGTFGWNVAALWLLAGATVSLLVGLVFSRMRLEHWIEPFVFASKTARLASLPEAPTLAERVEAAGHETVQLVRKVLPYLLVGVAVGAGIHGWVPTDFFAQYAGPDNPFALLVATLAGAPLYANPASIVPLASALYAKGVALGTLMAFMMSLVALSIPSLIMLRRVMRPQLLALFTSVVLAGIYLIGLVFNLFAA